MSGIKGVTASRKSSSARIGGLNEESFPRNLRGWKKYNRLVGFLQWKRAVINITTGYNRQPGQLLRNFARLYHRERVWCNNFLTFNSDTRTFGDRQVSSKKQAEDRESKSGNFSVLHRGSHLFHRKQKAQDKLDNLAAKPFFSWDYQPGLASSHPLSLSLSLSFAREWRCATLVPFPADNTYILALPRPPPIPVVLLVVSPSRSLLRAQLRNLVVWHPRSLEWQTARSEGLTFAERMKRRNVYLFARTLARSRYLRNAEYLGV